MEIQEEEKLQHTYSKVRVDRFYDKLVKGKGSFFIRMGSECNEVIFDNTHIVFATESKSFPAKMIFLFRMVQVDVKKFLHLNPFIKLPPKVSTAEYNFNYEHDRGKLTGTDLDHAFWRIAYVKGYIRKETYEKGLNPLAKAVRLASLSVLGAERKFDQYVDGVKVNTIVRRKKDEQLQRVYVDIRYSCYYMMYELSKLLGDDFDSWKTDCIYYRDTPENRKLVHDFFNERGMLYKQLI